MNLLSDAWIPTSAGTARVTELLEAPRNRNIVLCGMQYIAVLRLLLAICYDGGETSRGLLKNRAVQKRTLRQLEPCSSAFDLYQGCWTCADLTGSPGSLARLAMGVPARNNRVFHVHARDDQPTPRSEAAVACDLLTFQLSALDFGNSATGPRHHSPCATAALGIAIGGDLLETLALNLVPDSVPQKPKWKRQPNVQVDFVNQNHALPSSLAERYTWVAQAVRFGDGGVVTARGFKLDATGDPMTATVAVKEGREFASKAIRSSAWLTGCTLLGLNARPAATLEHARRLGIEHRVRVIAQVNDRRYPAVLVETIDRSFPSASLDTSLEPQVWKVRRELERTVGQDASSIFLSYLDDVAHEGSQVDPRAILRRTLEDLGARALLRKAEGWLA